ncbi:MAG TPA: hypothetical protein VMC07_00750 [Candidatus Omnitrophota bacterium]|nr:hypothetical protein [Candidatus Omnitrophota bacterium]
MVQDGLQTKEKILYLIKTNGPSLPVHIAKYTGLSILFSSAFLSELIADKDLKISNLRIGSSPLYFIPGQESMLENYSNHLKNREKEAFLLLKEKKFLKDRELEPAIRVALREIKDFAVAFQRDDEIFWRYFLVPETEFNQISSEKEVIKTNEPVEKEEIIVELPVQKKEAILEIKKEGSEKEFISSPKEKHARHEKSAGKIKKPVQEKNKHNNFFNKVKEFLNQKQVEILDISEIGISKIVFKVRKDEEYLVIAYNKKKISEQDIMNSYKKSQELGLPYEIIFLGEPLKRFENLIEAVKSLKNIEKIE